VGIRVVRNPDWDRHSPSPHVVVEQHTRKKAQQSTQGVLVDTVALLAILGFMSAVLLVTAVLFCTGVVWLVYKVMDLTIWRYTE